uniref:Uncharacterized protein n=1 Tax=Physcomitrium patens TaxID=3218 RepID=A0A2K1JTY6_PHYPA|nr:hypothetical protein PHYPA_014750 [Physcomitrium patens]
MALQRTRRSQGQLTAAAAPTGVEVPSSPRYFTWSLTFDTIIPLTNIKYQFKLISPLLRPKIKVPKLRLDIQ